MKSALKKLLPKYLIQKLQSTTIAIDKILCRIFQKNGFLSSIYYCFFSGQFRREHHSVLKGRMQYQQSLSEIDVSNALLRRNIHRLEKGLIMKPRRDVFAQEYIDETVAYFELCLSSSLICAAELKWAQDVLVSYFSVVGASTITAKAKEKFERLTLREFQKSHLSLPYEYQERTNSEISQEQLFALFKQRRSVRWYEQKQVDISLIKKAVEMAAQAPSACNRQPFQFYTITDPSKAQKIAAIPMGTKGFSHNVPALIVIVGDLSAYPSERDRHVIYIDGGLVAMQLMLAFESLGLSTCPINWPDIESYEQKMAKELTLEKHQRPIMLMAVGYGDSSGKIPYSQKKSADVLIKEVN